jgi:hypothetical protein
MHESTTPRPSRPIETQIAPHVEAWQWILVTRARLLVNPSLADLESCCDFFGRKDVFRFESRAHGRDHGRFETQSYSSGKI